MDTTRHQESVRFTGGFRSQVSSHGDLPQNVVDGQNVLVLGILAVEQCGGAGLNPNEATTASHEAIVVRHHLAFG